MVHFQHFFIHLQAIQGLAINTSRPLYGLNTIKNTMYTFRNNTPRATKRAGGAAKRLRLLLCCSLAILGGLLVTARAQQGPTTPSKTYSVGDKIPAFSVQMSNGLTLTDADLKGKVSVLVFFNTGCPDCRRELPHLQKMSERFPDVTFICISRAETEESIKSFWATKQLTLPYSAQPDRQLYDAFGAKGLPKLYLVNKDHVICCTYSDRLSKRVLVRQIKKLLYEQ